MNESVYAVAELLIYCSILFLTIYGVVLGYHWFTYGTKRKTAVSAMTVYVLGSGALIFGLVTAFNFL